MDEPDPTLVIDDASNHIPVESEIDSE